MKKLLVMLLAGTITLSLTACGDNSNNDAQDDTASEQQNEAAEIDVDEEEEEPVNEDAEEPEDITIGEQVEVNTEYGDFLLTVDNVRKSDWIERGGGEADKYVAVLVECDIDNISFEDPYNDYFFLYNFLSVTDDEGYIVNTLSHGYDDGLYSATLEMPVGSKARIVVAYNCGIDVQSLTININGQYILETQIEDEGDSENTEVTEDAEATEEASETESNNDTEQYDNRDFSSVVERMAELPAEGHIDLSDLVEVEEDGTVMQGYNVRYTSDNVNASTFQILCNPDKITILILPETLNGETGSSDFRDMIEYLMMAVDDTLSLKDANNLAIVAISDGSVTNNNITYSYSESSTFFAIDY